jgi:hypothetical protein
MGIVLCTSGSETLSRDRRQPGSAPAVVESSSMTERFYRAVAIFLLLVSGVTFASLMDGRR